MSPYRDQEPKPEKPEEKTPMQNPFTQTRVAALIVIGLVLAGGALIDLGNHQGLATAMFASAAAVGLYTVLCIGNGREP